MAAANLKLGSQIWIEPDDSAARIDHLCRTAKEAGISVLRLFLMWPWIEAVPGQWEFGVFDAVFDAARTHGLGLKATLTANSGPWHVGTPSQLHTHTVMLDDAHRAAAERYITRCVERYRDHPALVQWILWNEPDGNRTDEFMPAEALPFWQDMLRTEFSDDIAALNRRWRTGYAGFEEVPFAGKILHEASNPWHNWASYGPRLIEWRFKAAWLNRDIEWVAARVRRLDPGHETCVNPTTLHVNGAAGATDLTGMAGIVDVIGASYHPAWMFGFADRRDFPALMHAGVRLEYARPGVSRVEVTEVQTGNTLKSSNRPSDATADEVARFALASLAAGAESVTGWCLNARSHDFEAGDWALLDDMDQPSVRSRMNRRLADMLARVENSHGHWRRTPAQAYVVSDPRAHALEWIEAKVARTDVPGRLADDGAQGAALIAVALMGQGLSVDIGIWDALPDTGMGKLAVASHVVAIDDAAIARAVRFVETGGHLVLDATTAHKTYDASLWRPWPGGLAAAFDMRVEGLESDPLGWEVRYGGFAAARFIAARSRLHLHGTGWASVPGFRFVQDSTPFAVSRTCGAGRVTLCRGLIGPSLVHSQSARPVISALLNVLTGENLPALRPAAPEPGVWAATMATNGGDLTLVMAPSAADRQGRAVSVTAPRGQYGCHWSGEVYVTDGAGELSLPMTEGIAVLFRRGD